MNLVGLSARSPLVKYMGWDGELHYPTDNGELMSNDTLHFEWILFIYYAIFEAYRDREDVFTACDLLWYPVEGRPDIGRAPDTMVVFGRQKGHRPSWKQWEEGGIGPQFVVEVASRSNTEEEFREKLAFYEEYDVLEYFVYDFTRPKLTIWRRESPRQALKVVLQDEPWLSPLLGMKFWLGEGGKLQILLPDGRPARSHDQVLRDWEREKAQAESERERAESERERSERFAAKLRSLGVDPDAL